MSDTQERLAFIYLLNSMENAAQTESPLNAGYYDKRQAVLKYVRDLERHTQAMADRLEELASEHTPKCACHACQDLAAFRTLKHCADAAALIRELREGAEPAIIIKTNEAGQVFAVDNTGRPFDIFKHVGETFYATPPSLQAAVQAARERKWFADLRAAENRVRELSEQHARTLAEIARLNAATEAARIAEQKTTAQQEQPVKSPVDSLTASTQQGFPRGGAVRDVPAVAAVPNIEMVTIPKSEYMRLLRDSDWLADLEEAGVDNWSGYEEAIRIKRERQAA